MNVLLSFASLAPIAVPLSTTPQEVIIEDAVFYSRERGLTDLGPSHVFELGP